MFGGFTNLAGTLVTNVIESMDRNGIKQEEYRLSNPRAYALALSSKDRIVVAGGLNRCERAHACNAR